MNFSGQYLSYNEYRLLGGTMEIMPFNLLEFETRKILDTRTQNRLKNVADIPQEVKLCIYSMIDNIYNYANENEKSINSNISSESVGDYTVSYFTPNEIKNIINVKINEFEDTMFNYLNDVNIDGTPLIYLGGI